MQDDAHDPRPRKNPRPWSPPGFQRRSGSGVVSGRGNWRGTHAAICWQCSLRSVRRAAALTLLGVPPRRVPVARRWRRELASRRVRARGGARRILVAAYQRAYRRRAIFRVSGGWSRARRRRNTACRRHQWRRRQRARRQMIRQRRRMQRGGGALQPRDSRARARARAAGLDELLVYLPVVKSTAAARV